MQATVPYADLLAAVAAEPEPLVVAIEADLAAAGRRTARRRVVEALDWLVASLLTGERPDEAERAALAGVGAEAARRGEAVGAVLDRYLTATWVVWAAAVDRSRSLPARAGAEALGPLGTALLRTGDEAAAAIAQGFGEEDRELAGRSALARRELVNELLALTPGDAAAEATARRLAASLGVEVDAACTVVVAGLDREVDDDGPEVGRVTGILGRPSRALTRPVRPLVATERGRLVVIAPAGPGTDRLLTEALDALVGEAGWWAAVRGPQVPGLLAVVRSYAEATGALALVARLGPRRRIVPSVELALERALTADRELLRVAVEHELAPLRGARRGGDDLVDTLAAYLAAGRNARAAARALGIAGRTIAYRLRRIEALLGRPLTGPTGERLAAVLLAARLLDDGDVAGAGAADAISRAGPVGRSPRAPSGRAPRRPGRVRGSGRG